MAASNDWDRVQAMIAREPYEAAPAPPFVWRSDEEEAARRESRWQYFSTPTWQFIGCLLAGARAAQMYAMKARLCYDDFRRIGCQSEGMLFVAILPAFDTSIEPEPQEVIDAVDRANLLGPCRHQYTVSMLFTLMDQCRDASPAACGRYVEQIVANRPARKASTAPAVLAAIAVNARQETVTR